MSSPVETLTTQTFGGNANPQVAEPATPASLSKTDTSVKGPVTRLFSVFGGGGILRNVIVAIIAFMLLKFFVFR